MIDVALPYKWIDLSCFLSKEVVNSILGVIFWLTSFILLFYIYALYPYFLQ